MNTFEEPINGGAVLEELLLRSGVDYRREGETFQFLLTSRGCKWQTVCRGQGPLVLIYGIYPAQIADMAGALALCSRLNAQVVRGGFFVQDSRLVFRTSADMISLCDARETIARAIEYNAAAMSHFWTQLAGGADGSLL